MFRPSGSLRDMIAISYRLESAEALLVAEKVGIVCRFTTLGLEAVKGGASMPFFSSPPKRTTTTTGGANYF